MHLLDSAARVGAAQQRSAGWCPAVEGRLRSSGKGTVEILVRSHTDGSTLRFLQQHSRAHPSPGRAKILYRFGRWTLVFSLRN